MVSYVNATIILSRQNGLNCFKKRNITFFFGNKNDEFTKPFPYWRSSGFNHYRWGWIPCPYAPPPAPLPSYIYPFPNPSSSTLPLTQVSEKGLGFYVYLFCCSFVKRNEQKEMAFICLSLSNLIIFLCSLTTSLQQPPYIFNQPKCSGFRKSSDPHPKGRIQFNIGSDFLVFFGFKFW